VIVIIFAILPESSRRCIKVLNPLKYNQLARVLQNLYSIFTRQGVITKT